MKQILVKWSLIVLAFLVAGAVNGQPVLNQAGLNQGELIRQIVTRNDDNILGFQKLNHSGLENTVLAIQLGNENKAILNQCHDPFAEQSSLIFSYQQGAFNEMTIGQIGTGNTLFGFQLGYVTREWNTVSFTGRLEQMFSVYRTSCKDTWNAGERNIQDLYQEGSDNLLVAMQLGNDNLIQAGQKGIHNYLLILQSGSFNTLTGYEQSNQSDDMLTDTIIQEGDFLTISATGTSRFKLNGNSFTQRGANLSLEVNNDFINTTGGMEVIQTGRDMKVVIDQSYFL